MAAIDLSSSVTLVVKTPNKMIDDVQISCALDWTVEKLKRHLSDVYPSKPASKQQRLIYSGQLLLDHQTIKEFLREPIEGMMHTVHLVCPPSPSHSTPTTPTPPLSQPSPASSATPTRVPDSTSSTPAQADGLRHRGTPMQTPSPFNYPFPQMWNMNSPPFTPPQGYPSPGYMSQQQWMQHLHQMQQQYQQQMAAGRVPPHPFMFMPHNMGLPQMHFMQHPQHVGLTFATPPSPTTPPVDQQLPQQQAPPPPPPADQGNEEVRMNAGGGVANDDDEENLNNDWLDKVYTLCRVGILLSIVWFYSSTGRFLTLISLLALIYMYQWGVFRWLTQNRNAPARVNRQEVFVPPLEAQADQPQAQGDANPGQDNAETPEGRGAETTDGEQPAPPPPPQGPSAFTIALNFVSTFFTSLIPQTNDAIPGN